MPKVRMSVSGDAETSDPKPWGRSDSGDLASAVENRRSLRELRLVSA
jgi:hypothetical protein